MIRNGVAALRAHGFTIAVIAAAYVVGYVSTVQTKPLFAPDSRYYAGMALWFGGTDQRTAAARVADYSTRYGWESPRAHVLFGWGLTQPRVVYPALSAPFVKLWGIPGLVVVPGVAMALLVLVSVVLLARRWGTLAAVIPVLLVCASPQLMFYGSAMLTESLTALWSALLLLVAWRYGRRPTVLGVVAMVALTVVAGFTRQATLIPAAAFTTAWLGALALKKRPNPWAVPALAVGGTAVVVQVLQAWLFPTFSQLDQFKMKTGADTLTGAIMKSPQLAWNILRVDVNNMAYYDRALFVLLALALLSMVIFWRRTESHLLLGSLLAYELYNVTNGTPTMFRYGMPGLIFVLLSVTMLVAEAAGALGRDGQPSDRSEETPDVDTAAPRPGVRGPLPR